MRKWKKNLDVAASVLGGSIGEWAYAKLNGFGSVVVELKFASTDFRESIEAAAVAAGWVVEDTTAWTDSCRMTLVRTGSRVVGASSREGYITDLGNVLSSIPNRLLVLDPKFVHPDYKQMPRWSLVRGNVTIDSEEETARPLGVYGEHRAVSGHVESRLPGVELVANNPASRLAKPFDSPAKGVDWRLTGLFVSLAMIGCLTFEALKPIQRDLWFINWVPAVLGDDVWAQVGGEYVLMVLWMLLCGVIYVVTLLVATVVGCFKESEFKLHFAFNKNWAKTENVRAALNGWGWPKKDSPSDRGTKTYIMIKTLAVVLLIVGISFFAGRLIWSLGVSASQLQGGLPAAFILALMLGLVWFGSRLTRAHWLLTRRSFPRLALNVGSAAVALTILVRLPMWAYLEGVGAGTLVSTTDWTQIISFTPSLLALLAVAVMCWLLVWVGKRVSSTQQFMTTIMGIATIVLVLVIVVQTQMTSGYNLRVQGTSEFTGINYPVPACLKQDSSANQSIPVWVLGTRDSQTVVTTRSPNRKALQEPGQVTSFPADGIVLRLVPFDHLDEGDSSKACTNVQ